jgi:ankyrin repeat protein
MTAGTKLTCIAACVITLSTCGVRKAENGGEPEQQLAAATMAADVAKVSQLLTSGVNPNKVVTVKGDSQSPWYLALNQVRPQRPETVDIVKLMLKAGANPNEVWGSYGGSSRPKESAWHRFWRTGARQAGYSDDQPMHMAMMYPVPEVIQALVAAGFNPRYGGAALEQAVESQNSTIVHTLVEAGVDVNTQAAAITPLVAAIEARNVALMTYLENHGAREKP